MLCLSVKWKSGTASLNMDSRRSKQEACFACGIRVWLAFNHNTSVTSAKRVLCLKRIARAIKLAAVNQVCVIHEAMKGCKNLKIH